MDTQQQAALQDAYETLLLSYAAGLLDQAQSLIVASHIALSPQAREKVRTCEAVGGALMEKYCEPVPMKKQSLQNVLSRLEGYEPQEREELYELVFPGISIPLCLKRTIACRVQEVRWQTLRPGVQSFELSLECRQSKTLFMKADKGVEAPRLQPRGLELTLVLDGALADESGIYQRGDLVILDESCKHHTATSCRHRGGFYMVVSSSPAHMSGLHRLLHSLFRI